MQTHMTLNKIWNQKQRFECQCVDINIVSILSIFVWTPAWCLGRECPCSWVFTKIEHLDSVVPGRSKFVTDWKRWLELRTLWKIRCLRLISINLFWDQLSSKSSGWRWRNDSLTYGIVFPSGGGKCSVVKFSKNSPLLFLSLFEAVVFSRCSDFLPYSWAFLNKILGQHTDSLIVKCGDGSMDVAWASRSESIEAER